MVHLLGAGGGSPKLLATVLRCKWVEFHSSKLHNVAVLIIQGLSRLLQFQVVLEVAVVARQLHVDHTALPPLVALFKEAVEFVGPSANAADVQPEVAHLLRGRADGEWVPLVLGNLWNLDVDIVPRLKVEALWAGHHQVCDPGGQQEAFLDEHATMLEVLDEL